MEAGSGVEIALLTLCVSGFIVNGLLSVAQAIARRKAVMSIVWSMVYLILCSCSWVTMRQEKDYSRELASYNELNAKWQQEKANPYALQDNEGRTLLELAASLGKDSAVRELLALPGEKLTREKAAEIGKRGVNVAYIEVGEGKRKASEMERILRAGKREEAGFTAPSRGLFLREVYYEDWKGGAKA